MENKLSDAEILEKIKELKGQGLTNAAIATTMFISEMTVYRVLQEFGKSTESVEE